jgi:hypothetical protein
MRPDTMKPALLLGLLALLPAALNAQAPAAPVIAMAICGGSGPVPGFPSAPTAPTKPEGQPCCAKACHTGGCRKRFLRAP